MKAVILCLIIVIGIMGCDIEAERVPIEYMKGKSYTYIEKDGNELRERSTIMFNKYDAFTMNTTTYYRNDKSENRINGQWKVINDTIVTSTFVSDMRTTKTRKYIFNRGCIHELKLHKDYDQRVYCEEW